MLQMLGKKSERLPIVKIGIAISFLPHLCFKPNFPIFQKNDLCSTGKLVSVSFSRLLFHIVKVSYLKNMRPNDNPHAEVG